MRAIIEGRMYSTETATELGHYSHLSPNDLTSSTKGYTVQKRGGIFSQGREAQ